MIKGKGLIRLRLIWHLMSIILFLTLPLILTPRPPGIPLFNFTMPAIRDLIAGAFMLIFLYINYYFLVNKLLLKKKYLTYILILLIGLAVIVLLPSVFTGHIPFILTPTPPEQGVPPGLIQNNFVASIGHNILLFLTVIAFSIFLRVQGQFSEVEAAKNKMELLSLKEQINPHFLFNTLNNIYGQAMEDNSHQAATSILKLSEMLRHVVHDAQNEWVPLDKELAYLENYIQLQRQRLGEGVALSFLTKGTFDNTLKIAPLILIPFIENAFKHGVNPDKKSSIKIVISVAEKTLSLLVENDKANIRLKEHEKSGAGLNITLNRLNMLYINKHNLLLDDQQTKYIVKLNMELND